MFSIIIPTFNNLDYLKLCINSIKKNSAFQHEIIVHVNEGIDGNTQYLKLILVFVLHIIKPQILHLINI